MKKVVYPNGVTRWYMWIDDKYGYYRKGKDIFRYHLPKLTENKAHARME